MSLDFGSALHALKSGQRVRRAGWNGKGMWLALTEGRTISGYTPSGADVPEGVNADLRGAALALATTERPASITIGAHIDMRAADGTLVIGWLASQTDMLAEDWEVVS